MFRLYIAVLVSLFVFTPLKIFASAHEEPSNPAMAINEPDRYAWLLFMALNWPADVPLKKSNPSKPFGAPGPVVWETWRNVRNQAPDTTFKPDGSDPGEWLGTQTQATRTENDVDNSPLQQQLLRRGRAEIMFDRPVSTINRNETRLNRDMYEFIRKNTLYNIEGQELLIGKVQAISFPVNSKEIKAQWRRISESDKPRYHWVEISVSGQVQIYGLTALHVITKDIPNWFWATFEHEDNKLPANQGGRAENEGWLIKSKDKFACPTPPHDCEKIPAGIGLENTKWQNYRLRGTQVDFVDVFGQPTILANSQPEQGFQATSSCITCHARATIGSRVMDEANRLEIFKPQDPANPDKIESYTGSPNPEWFANDGTGKRYIHLDFVWSLFRAQRIQR